MNAHTEGEKEGRGERERESDFLVHSLREYKIQD